jgi:Ser/Thr protein kinase RdoA (MazF antagonist)
MREMGLATGAALTQRLLGLAPDRVRTLVARPDRGVYVVTVGADEFVCKIADDQVAVAREAEGERRAGAAGIPVPEVIATGDGEIATRFIDGTPLTRIRAPDAWRAAGRVLRRVHAIEPDGMWGKGLDAPDSTWRASIDAHLVYALDDCGRELGFDSAQAARIRDACAASPVFDAPMRAWCHGDCQPDHFLIDPATNDVIALIDWSDHGKADAAWDLAVLTLDDEEMLTAVLDGYAPSAEERRHIAAALPLLRVLRLLGEAHWLFQHGYPYDEPLTRALEWRGWGV